ncbi:hypothetical protein [Gaetbulibacter aestuarii]|uniref:DUF4398 domain-containing protein n=1 Tax=Gaetbulibacter aestuarii TaxID=1502358 RepID=A0ABW7MYL8_9FLAO
MKKIYYLFFFFLSYSVIAQTACDDANYYIVSSYSHVKDSYESNNIDHVKYYADRAVGSLKSFLNQMKSCDCVNAERLAKKSYDILEKVAYQETYEDARFFVKRARDSIKAGVIEDDKCSVLRGQNNASTTATTTEVAYSDTSEDQTALSDLEKEQLKLQQQQEALKRKEQEIKAKLAAQQEKEQMLEKQQLIRNYQNALRSSVKSYNQTLKLCGSSHDAFTYAENSEGLENKSVNEINEHYKREIETMTNEFLSALNSVN